MKDDFSQDEKTPTKSNQTGNSSSVDDDSLDWAKQAYLQLKQKQKEEKEERQNEIKEKEILNKKNIDNLHFEACYYSKIEWAIANKIKYFASK